MRGEVYIGPVPELRVPADGSMIDPESGRFWASWQDEAEIEDAEFDGAQGAIWWGRARAEIVLIRLGNRGDTYFSAGTAAADDDEGPMPLWPPDGPPPGGWRLPPLPPTLAEIEAVVSEVAEGKRSAEDAAAWAFPRMSVVSFAGGDESVFIALSKLTSGWMQVGDRLLPSDESF